jgi:hypothetical protein
VLGVDAGADAAEVSRAFRRRARLLHPDVDLRPEAVARFQALRAAYEVVRDAAVVDTATPASGPAPVVRRTPVARIDSPLLDASVDPPRRLCDPDWLVAGPVHVRPLGGSDPGEPGLLRRVWP